MMVGRRSFPFGTWPIFTGKLAAKVPGCNITNARGSQLGFGKKHGTYPNPEMPQVNASNGVCWHYCGKQNKHNNSDTKSRKKSW